MTTSNRDNGSRTTRRNPGMRASAESEPDSEEGAEAKEQTNTGARIELYTVLR